MLNYFGVNKYSFDFAGFEFQTFDKKFIPILLGKHGNQTAINTAGSAWKKVIHRNLTRKQAERDYINPKWSQLYNFLQSHLTTKNSMFTPKRSFIINRDLDDLFTSTNVRDKTKLSEFLRFREINIHNLKYFKDDPGFRKKVLPLVYDDDYDFNIITPQYTYILLVLYIATYYTIFNNYKFKKFALKVGLSWDEYRKKFLNGLKSNTQINDITAFCYTQYFWFDFRLSDSSHSEIHRILYNMFNELKLS